jgi:hypothetical protein
VAQGVPGVDDMAGTYYQSAWSPVREAVEAQLREDGDADPVEVAMERFFAAGPGGAEAPSEAGTIPRDLVKLYFHVLRENERLPADNQLELKDLRLIHSTLTGTLSADQDLRSLVDRIFALVQRKIERGLVSQAWILLQIFDYDRAVRLWNERNLYLEEMTLRFGDRTRLARELSIWGLKKTVERAAKDLERAPAALAAVSSAADVTLNLYQTDEDEREAWAGLFDTAGSRKREGGPAPGGTRHSIESMTTRKWRVLPPSNGIDAGLPLGDCLTVEAVRDHLLAHVKAAYFLLLVSNPTGWEAFLPRVYGWFLDHTKGESATIFSDLHRMVTLEECSVREGLLKVYGRFAEGAFLRLASSAGNQDLQKGLSAFLTQLAKTDLRQVPAGNYSLTGFVLDQVFGLTYPDPLLAWQVHRLL